MRAPAGARGHQCMSGAMFIVIAGISRNNQELLLKMFILLLKYVI